MAQLCDAQTAVSLARSNCDSRWFLPPRQYGVEKETREVLAEVKSLIEKLVPNKCAEYVLEHTFTPIKEPVGDEGVSYRVSVSRFETESLKQALSALVHLTATESNCRKIIDAGGLLVLIEVEKLYRDSIDMKLMLSRIVANLSVCEDRAYDFFASGWIGIMSRWQKDIDMRMQVTTDIALSNLDRDDPNGFNYESNVYPLYPKGRRKNKPDVDVVFIHGLLGKLFCSDVLTILINAMCIAGGVFVTWRQKDLKPQAASLLGKKHVSVNLVSSHTKADNGGTGDERADTSTTNNIMATTRDGSIPTKLSQFNWSAKKSSFDEDQAENRTEGKRTVSASYPNAYSFNLNRPSKSCFGGVTFEHLYGSDSLRIFG